MARIPGRSTRRLTAVASLLGLFACDGGGGGGFSPIADTHTNTDSHTDDVYAARSGVGGSAV